MTQALLFPGQGSQKPGMGKELAANFPLAKQTFEEADDALGDKISALCFEGESDELSLTANAQPAILATSIAAMRVAIEERGLSFDVTAGHSLGEFSALVAAGALNFSDAIRLVRLRGQAMQKAVPVGQGGMAALIGLDAEAVLQLCKSVAKDQVLGPANLNGGGQIVVSGHAEAIDRLVTNAKAAGAKRAIKLKVSAPFHSSLMQPAADVMAKALSETTIGDMIVPVVSNVDAKPNRDKNRVAELLVSQVTGAVRWEESIQTIVNEGVTTAVECGHGAVIKGLCKRISKDLVVSSMGTPADLENI